MKRNIVLMGPAGSGKGTQGVRISQQFGMVHISTGAMLRQEVKMSTTTGELVREYVHQGLLVPDDILENILKERLLQKDCESGFILDGFPRTLEQAQILDQILTDIKKPLDVVFEIQIPKDVLMKRIVGRYFCASCNKLYNKFFENPKQLGVCDVCGSKSFIIRDDDTNIQAINNRLEIYEKVSGEIRNFYRKKGLIYMLDGINSVTTINQDIQKVIIS